MDPSRPLALSVIESTLPPVSSPSPAIHPCRKFHPSIKKTHILSVSCVIYTRLPYRVNRQIPFIHVPNCSSRQIRRIDDDGRKRQKTIGSATECIGSGIANREASVKEGARSEPEPITRPRYARNQSIADIGGMPYGILVSGSRFSHTKRFLLSQNHPSRQTRPKKTFKSSSPRQILERQRQRRDTGGNMKGG